MFRHEVVDVLFRKFVAGFFLAVLCMALLFGSADPCSLEIISLFEAAPEASCIEGANFGNDFLVGIAYCLYGFQINNHPFSVLFRCSWVEYLSGGIGLLFYRCFMDGAFIRTVDDGRKILNPIMVVVLALCGVCFEHEHVVRLRPAVVSQLWCPTDAVEPVCYYSSLSSDAVPEHIYGLSGIFIFTFMLVFLVFIVFPISEVLWRAVCSLAYRLSRPYITVRPHTQSFQNVSSNLIDVRNSMLKAIDAGTFSCSICLDTMVLNGTGAVLPCLHVYHKPCLDGWLSEGHELVCPMCKLNLQKFIKPFGSFSYMSGKDSKTCAC